MPDNPPSPPYQGGIETSDLLGKPFQFGGRGPESYDCYGLAIEVSRRFGVSLPSHISPCEAPDIDAVMQQRQSLFEQIEVPLPGCLLFLMIHPPFVSHCGVMLDRLRFIHIMQTTSVTIERIDNLAWQRRVKGFYRCR